MQGGWQPPPGGGHGYGPPGHGAPVTGGPVRQHPFAPTGAGPIPSYGDYEFNAYENGILDKTAARARTWGVISAVLGGAQLLGGTCGAIRNPGWAMYLPTGVVMLVVGLTFVGFANSLRSVVRTQGDDIAHLMTAMQKLGTAFTIQSIAFVISVALGAVVAFFAFFFFLAGAASP
jgi:hypothetical protein